MHAEGAAAGPSKKALARGDEPGPHRGAGLPTTDDEIQEKYLERAIRELNELTHRLQECSHCPRGNLMPVLGSGHPQADVMLLKFAPTAAEIEEGVAFYGRAGNALRKSFKRLNIDPLVVYGTLCVKCPVADPSLAGRRVHRAHRRGAGDRPAPDDRGDGRARPGDAERGRACHSRARSSRGSARCRASRPTIDALYTPDIDESLDSEDSKREFWAAFRALGDWYADLPPY